MSKNAKVLVGIWTFLPVVLVIFLVVNALNMAAHVVMRGDNMTAPEAINAAIPIVICYILLILCALSLLIFYIVHAVNNKSIESGERVMWILLFIFLGSIACPIYFFIKIVPEKPKQESIGF